MSLHPRPIDPVPEDTALVAGTAFQRAIPPCACAADSAPPTRTRPSPRSPPRGASRQSPPGAWRWCCSMPRTLRPPARRCMHGQIDWKHALSPDLTDPGFDASVLSEFRDRLVAGDAEQALLACHFMPHNAHHLHGQGA